MIKPQCSEKWPGPDSLSVSSSNLFPGCSYISVLGFFDIPAAWLLMIKAFSLTSSTGIQELATKDSSTTHPSLTHLCVSVSFVPSFPSTFLCFFLLSFLPFPSPPLPPSPLHSSETSKIQYGTSQSDFSAAPSISLSHIACISDDLVIFHSIKSDLYRGPYIKTFLMAS